MVLMWYGGVVLLYCWIVVCVS